MPTLSNVNNVTPLVQLVMVQLMENVPLVTPDISLKEKPV